MDIIFGYVSYWTIPIIKILKYLKFKVYYLYITEKEEKKINLANLLKSNNVYPLPLEFEKKISPEADFTICEHDKNEISYSNNVKLASDNLLKKYCLLFSTNNTKELRLLIQDFIATRQMAISGPLAVWSELHKEKKIIYISFKFKCFYNPKIDNYKISKIIIPLDFFRLIKVSLNKLFNYRKNNKSKIKILETNPESKFINKKVALITHKGITFGKKESMLYEKSLYYSSNKESYLHKKNILHLDYSNYPSPEKDINWVCLNKKKFPVFKVYLKTISAGFKNLYLIKSWPSFLVWLFFIHQYNLYLKYSYKIKDFKDLKLALIDYDILCPKTLILALKRSNITTIATQERFIHTFYSSYANVIVDIYFTASQFCSELIKKSKYFAVKNIIASGMYRSKYISLYKNEIPNEISKAKKEGKKILVILGYAPPENWFESNISLQTNWSSQVTFLEDAIKISEKVKDIFVVIKYKSFKCPIRNNKYFKNILDKIDSSENIIMANNYNQPFYSYKLCSNADLVVAKSTSLADECLSLGIPVLFYEYTHNMKGIQSDAFNYSPSRLMCYDFEELLKKSESILLDEKSSYKNEINNLIKKIYYVKEKDDTKKKIIRHLESLVYKK